MSAILKNQGRVRIGSLAVLRDLVLDKPSIRFQSNADAGKRAGCKSAMLRVVSIAATAFVE